MSNSPAFPAPVWKCCDRRLELGSKTAIMGVLNVTPDSFSDGGEFADPDLALSQALSMVEQGAAIIDIGGESSRPGAAPVSEAEEAARVIPVIEKLASRSDVLISVDTVKAGVARQALASGAHIINDISGFSADPGMVDVAAANGAGVVIMHMQGAPQTMQQHPAYSDVTSQIALFLEERMQDLMQSGVARECIAIDPGIGFGKSLEHNLQLLRDIPEFAGSGLPVLIGLSRKSMLGAITGCGVNDRLAAGLAGLSWSAMHGAHILRVHDVKESCEAVAVIDILMTK